MNRISQAQEARRAALSSVNRWLDCEGTEEEYQELERYENARKLGIVWIMLLRTSEGVGLTGCADTWEKFTRPVEALRACFSFYNLTDPKLQLEVVAQFVPEYLRPSFNCLIYRELTSKSQVRGFIDGVSEGKSFLGEGFLSPNCFKPNDKKAPQCA